MAKVSGSVKDLSNKIEKAVLDELRPLVTDEIVKIYDAIVDKFYADYGDRKTNVYRKGWRDRNTYKYGHPKFISKSRFREAPQYYYRTGALREAHTAADGFGLNYGRVNSDEHVVGIKIGGEYIKPYVGESPYYNFKGESNTQLSINVIDNIILRGSHGNKIKTKTKTWIPPKMSPAPNFYLNNDSVGSYIRQLAEGKSFSAKGKSITGLESLLQTAIQRVFAKGVM